MTFPQHKAYNNWHEIPRADDHSTSISLKAAYILHNALQEIKKEGYANYDHEYISKLTNCKYEQNNNLLKQLADILDIKFYRSVIVKGKKYHNTFLVTIQPNGELILNNPKKFYSQLPSKKQLSKNKNIPEFIIPNKRKQDVTYH